MVRTPLLLALCITACSQSPQPEPRAAVAEEATIARPPVQGPCSDLVALGPSVRRGMSYVHSYSALGERGYGSVESGRSLHELLDLGVDALSLMPFGFMTGTGADHIRVVGTVTAGETDGRLRREIARAHDRGLRVLLKPHIWIRGGAWRGAIDPGSEAGWQRFFASYREFLLHYAETAAREHVEVLSIGVELSSATRRSEERWRGLIRDVRQRFAGKLVYSANWDEAQGIGFWDALDFIGVQFFAPLADRPGASEAQLLAAARGHFDRLAVLSKRFERPVLLTEFGYKSVEGTTVAPHLWPERLQADTQVSETAQLRAYRAFLRAAAERDFLAGMYAWKWFTDSSSTEEGPNGFSPRGKAAMAALRCAYARPRAQPR